MSKAQLSAQNVCTVGIDPGVTGAIAILCGQSLCVYDVPAVRVKRGKTHKLRVDAPALQQILVRAGSLSPDYTLIEDVWGMSGQSAPAAHTFGVVCGQLSQGCVAAGLAPGFVSSMRWKRSLNVPAEKDAALNVARAVWPGNPAFKRAKDHNRAEAALIALYAQQQFISGASTVPPKTKPPVKTRAPKMRAGNKPAAKKAARKC